MNAAQRERLYVLAEECGETVKAVNKALRHGFDKVNPYDVGAGTNRSQIEQECGDVLAAIRMVAAASDIDIKRIEKRASNKADSIRQWMHCKENQRPGGER